MTNKYLLKKLNYLLYKFKNLEKYRKLKLPLSSFSDIKTIPFSTRDDLRDFNLSDAPVLPFNITATSGSTKSKLIVCHSLNCYRVHLKRQIKIYNSIDIKKGDCCLNLCSYSFNGAAKIMETAFKQMGVTVIPLGEISDENKLNEAIYIIDKLKPNIINSYVNQVYDIFIKVKQKHNIQKCILNGEPLVKNFKNLIERISGAKVYNNYGSMEFSGFAIAQNPKDAYLRLFEDGLFIEVLKENGKADIVGKGKIIVTDLTNYSMPFIRYILGDEVDIKLINNKRVIKIFGRGDNYILLHGEVESKKAIIETLLRLLGHPNFSLVIYKDRLTYKDKIILNIYAECKNLMNLKNIVKKYLPFITNIRIPHQRILRTSTGKFRHFVDLR